MERSDKAYHCLVIDDDRSFLLLMEGMLKALGYKLVTTGRSGSEAFLLLSRAPRPVDVILCDFSMDAGNGLQLLKAVRTGQVKNVRPDACFIMVTGFADADLIKHAASLDVNGYVLKPLSPARLEEAIAKGRKKVIALDPARYAAVTVPSGTV